MSTPRVVRLVTVLMIAQVVCIAVEGVWAAFNPPSGDTAAANARVATVFGSLFLCAAFLALALGLIRDQNSRRRRWHQQLAFEILLSVVCLVAIVLHPTLVTAGFTLLVATILGLLLAPPVRAFVTSYSSATQAVSSTT